MVGKKILITGAGGFIGSALAKRLDGNKLVLISAGAKKPVHGIDIRDKNIGTLFEGCDSIVHLAALGEPQKSLGMDAFMDVNCKGTLSVLEAAKNSGAKKFIFASSTLVYGKPKYLPIDENHPLNPEGPYAISKSISEKDCMNYRDCFDVICLRFSNVYGAGNRNNVIYYFLSSLLRGLAPRINGGSQKRDFIYIDDLVDALLLAIEKGSTGTFNVSFGKSSTIDEVYSLCQRVAGRNIEPERVAHDDEDYEISNESIRKTLGFEPKTDLETGIQKTLEGMR